MIIFPFERRGVVWLKSKVDTSIFMNSKRKNFFFEDSCLLTGLAFHIFLLRRIRPDTRSIILKRVYSVCLQSFQTKFYCSNFERKLLRAEFTSRTAHFAAHKMSPKKPSTGHAIKSRKKATCFSSEDAIFKVAPCHATFWPHARPALIDSVRLLLIAISAQINLDVDGKRSMAVN